MLVLTRKQGEEVVIPTLGIKVCVVRVQGNRATLAFEAPRDAVVLRGEIVDKPRKDVA